MSICALACYNYSLQLIQNTLRADHQASPSPSISPNRSTSPSSFFATSSTSSSSYWCSTVPVPLANLAPIAYRSMAR